MSRGEVRALLWLSGAALRDGLGRRLGLAVAVAAILGLLAAESCTDFGPGSFVLNDRVIGPSEVAGWLAPAFYGLEILTLVVLVGVLASDHLARPLEDGSAALWLARPVGRGVYAVSRLFGVLGVGIAAGAILLGGTGALLVGRHGLDPGPAAEGALVGMLAATTLAALAMAASLALARAAVALLLLGGVALIVFANGLAAAGLPIGGFLGAIDRFAPPLGTAVFEAVRAWNPFLGPTAEPSGAATRLALWALASVALLVLAFRRVEIGK